MAALGSERDRPLYFAGRREELTKLAERLAYIKNTGDPGGGMVLIDGVQGIGKTQLAAEFVRRECANDPNVASLSLSTEELPADASELFDILTRHLPKPRTSKTNALQTMVRNVKRMPLAIGSIELRERRRLLADLLRSSEDEGWWQGRALVLVVDEVQNIDAEGRATLRVLHEGTHGCPIMVVGAGLQHARSALAGRKTTREGVADDAGISRFAFVLTLERLSPEESLDAVAKGIAASGEGELPTDLAEHIAHLSVGFPQHVHAYVDAALRVLREHGSLHSAPAQQQVAARGDAARQRYYELRLTSLESEHQEGVLRLAAAMRRRAEGPAIHRRRAVAVVRAALGDGVDGNATVQSAIQKGVLSESPAGMLTFPIPSFYDYALSLLGDQEQAAPLPQ